MIEEKDTFKPFSFGPIIEGEMNERQRIFQGVLSAFDLTLIVTTPIRFNKKRICHATGMSYKELNDFLESHKFDSNGKHISFEALEAIEKWYLKKLKRYVRNALSSELESGDKATFLEFCRKYKKRGIKEVKSWKDIDEDLILLEFRSDCEGSSPSISGLFGIDGTESLLARIYSSYLFHTQFRATKYRSIVLCVLAFIISHRYHIFTSEADANTGETDNVVLRPTKNGLTRLGTQSCMGLPPRQIIQTR